MAKSVGGIVLFLLAAVLPLTLHATDWLGADKRAYERLESYETSVSCLSG